ncbi:D-glycerate dehydrogenase [Compostibacillus humi]|uniref:D-glycerate dehydrogenase n=1 Tax=Compostibacillus humi TaxID=1245525 RepID=A0A8J2XGC6_9BACI|nr:D-glycerate dehydrogenase [Compostibacillus humi]GFZ83156.1 D-glycerate dehydrogenase [Compostibacillus humi]
MEKDRIFITRKIPEHLLEPYTDMFDFSMWENEEEPVPKDVLFQEAEQADGLICMVSEKVDKALIEHGKRLKVIANVAVGYDNIDVEEATKRGIIVTNTPDVLTETTADLGFALLMATARRIIEANKFIAENRWREWGPFLLAGADIHHKTIGIVGMGRIGEAIARRANGFSMSVLYHNRSRRPEAEKYIGAQYVSFEELLERSDFVVSVVPYSKESHEMFDKQAFAKMKKSAIFINISRGGVVDEQALYDALKNKEIAAAGLDVFAKEPIGSDSPFMALDNCVCLPHIGSASVETREKMITLALENVKGTLCGEGPLTPVK